MKFEDFEVEFFNDSQIVRVTHKVTGTTRNSEDVTREGAIKLMQDIRDEIEEKKRPCSFAIALEAVIKEDKGMHVKGDTSVVRAQFPDEYSMMDLPYLYITTEVGQVPWTVDSCAPFATWLIVD
ncbi:hypothetical protein OAO65_02290 [Flavobacteriales bacterium]|nr:hypothetical protein [Flavobacteriales bacterium]